ncbi:MAG: SpoIIE family protein phosphatase [Candidatus Eisenbacteria bacterium]
MESVQPQRWSRLLFGATALLVLAGQILEAERAAESPSLSMTLQNSEVVSVTEAGSAATAGFHPGDTIVRVGAREAPPAWGANVLLRSLKAGVPVTIVVRRAGDRISLEYIPQPPSRVEAVKRMAVAGVGILTLIIGLLVFIKKPRRLTFIFASICLGMGYLVHLPYVPLVPWLVQARGILQDVLTLGIPPLFAHLFLLFPMRHPLLERRPRLQAVLYLPSAALLAFFLIVRLNAGAALPAGIPRLQALSALILWALGVAAAIALFTRAYRGARTEISRRKVRVMLWGTALGTLPIASYAILFHVWPRAGLPGAELAALSVLLIPLSFGYAIVRHGVFDATLIARRSLAFSLVGAVLVVVYLAMQMLLQTLLPSWRETSPVGISFFSLVAAALLYVPAQLGIRALLGGLLGPERNEPGSILPEFRRTLHAALEHEEMVRLVTDFVGAALAADRVLLFEREPCGTYVAVYAYGLPARELTPLRLTPSLSRQLALLDGPTDWGDVETDLPYGYLSASDQRVLAAGVTERVLPLRAGALDDLILVGRSVIGEPFHAEELRVAEAIVGEARLALADAILEQRVSEEQRLRYEMDVARELQEGLLPKDLPQLESLELSGFSIPCRGVGGDYYDCMRTASGKLLLAIGDVSGKGVPGAILAANLQALMRGEGTREQPPRETVRRLNRRLCEMHKPERYVTFCLLQIDPLTGGIEYCNAGHPSPLLARAGGEIEDLCSGGLPLGIQAQAQYEGGRTTMRAGDVLLLLTDGVTERRRGNGDRQEDFGRGRIHDLLKAGRRSSARALQQAILTAVRDFAPTPLDDDTTLLVVKML